MKQKITLLLTLVATVFGANASAVTTNEVPGVDVQPASYFYTGRPYDEDLGAYTFSYRHYSPEQNRWTSADPSGFPDGANCQAYSPTPTNQLDPYGLRTITATHTDHHVTVWGVPVSGSAGSQLSISIPQDGAPHQVDDLIQAASQVRWDVSGTTRGWVVQHVTFDLSGVYNEDGTQYTPPPDLRAEYWEAWHFSPTLGVQYGGLDNFLMTFPETTYGHARIIGKVDFYSEDAVSSDDPWNWGVIPQAGVLMAKTTQPTFWTGSGFNHRLEMTWE
jgi:RHS repeat-associated protein